MFTGRELLTGDSSDLEFLLSEMSWTHRTSLEVDLRPLTAAASILHSSEAVCSQKKVRDFKTIFYAVRFVSRKRPFRTEAQIGLS